MTRTQARTKIIQAANRQRLKLGPAALDVLGVYSMRHLQQAVFVCRQRRLVKDEVLKAAGFNERRRA